MDGFTSLKPLNLITSPVGVFARVCLNLVIADASKQFGATFCRELTDLRNNLPRHRATGHCGDVQRELQGCKEENECQGRIMSLFFKQIPSVGGISMSNRLPHCFPVSD